MANLTLAIDDELLKRARIRAIEQGTSVNAVVREYLEKYADVGGPGPILADFLGLAVAADAGGDASGRNWSREDLYDL